ncbi:hypothetical protein [Methanopyrus kandleri]|uniref:Uncharacterized protein n=2 Tax=Methanopyrus kandleri TaxID=2320 RepID=Q8TY56_METKA|nr:hypothetical protein [Methanopyrus kandleri]AAM01665.1 Uncharacterized protein MK0450 [Methanopyrus kandleri AV19]HII70390.1 hypothetical protein [Methanopyrus kandleri]
MSLVKSAKNDVVIVVGEDIDEFNKGVLSSVCKETGKVILFGKDYLNKFSIDEKLETSEESLPIKRCDVAIVDEDTEVDGKLLLDVPADEYTINEVLSLVKEQFKEVCDYERGVEADVLLVIDSDRGRLRIYANGDEDEVEDKARELCMKVAERVVEERRSAHIDIRTYGFALVSVALAIVVVTLILRTSPV